MHIPQLDFNTQTSHELDALNHVPTICTHFDDLQIHILHVLQIWIIQVMCILQFILTNLHHKFDTPK